MSRVDLVTLSACQTGLGKPELDEGLIGLQRAFQVSGARNVIASLWPVDDLATSVLMKQFYSNLIQQGLSAGESLSKSQKWMLLNYDSNSQGLVRGDIVKANEIEKKTKSKRLHPKYWAAWTLHGF